MPFLIRLLSLQSNQNGDLGAVFWVYWIARSHTVLSQANMVVVERYELNFWWKSLEESMQCEPVHYRDAKTTSFLPKISFKTVLPDPLEVTIVSARSLIANRRFLNTKFFISMTVHQLMFFFVRGARCLQRVLCLLWTFYATRMFLYSIEPDHRRPSATSSTFLQKKFHSAHKI